MNLHVLRLVALTAFVVAGCHREPTPVLTRPDKSHKKAPVIEKQAPITDLEQKIEKPDDKKPKILAKAPWQSNQLAPRTNFIRDAKKAAIIFGAPFDKWNDKATQDEASSKLAKLFKKDSIDWGKQMVLFVEAGQKKTGGHSVEITTLDVEDNTLIVKWKVIEPKPDAPAQQNVNPGVAVLVDRFEGTITFDPPVK